MLEQLLDAADGIAYAVDAQYRIVAVGRRRWDRFAVETGASELCADRVVGRSLFEFVGGLEVEQAYWDLADRVFSTGEPVVVALRVDSGGAGRELRLSVAPLRLADERPGLLFQARIVGGTAPARLDILDFKTVLNALLPEVDLPIVTMCSYCRLLRRPGSRDEEDWITAEEYHRLGGPGRVRISHGMCADCDAARFPDP